MNRRNKRITSYFVLFSLLVVLGVAFAILQANLQINGIAKISENQWNVHFENIVVNPDSVPIGIGDTAATIDLQNNCKVDFSVTLSLPGDFYEFTVDVKNEGSIDAMIGSLEKTLKVNNVETEIVPEYLNYTVTYDGGDEILENHLLKKNTFVTYKVRVEFKTDIEEEDLPDATTISTSLEPQYIQADDTAIKKAPNYPCTFDGEMVQGAEYTNGQYTYRYMQEVTNYNTNTNVVTWSNISSDGWGVHLSDPTSTDPVTSRLCTSINNKPIVSTSYMFYNSQTTSIDTSSFDTSNVTNMLGMFEGNTALTEIEVSTFNTSSVTNMREMFAGCSSLTTLDLSNFNTTNVTNMRAMFASSSLSILDLSNFNTSNVTNMVEMFASSSSLIELNISNFDLSNSTSFMSIANGIFGNTSSLKKINMSNWKLPADMSNSIFGYSGTANSPIEEINVTGWNLSNTTNAYGMFATNSSNGKGGTGLKRIVGLDTWNTSNITNMSIMFSGLSSLQSLDLSSFNTSNVTNMNDMFYRCSSLIELNISNFDLSKSTSFQSIASSIFSGTTSLKKINMSNWKLPINMSDSIFRNGGSASSPIEEINVTGWDLSNTTNASGMLATSGSNGTGGTGLKRIIGLETWNTSNITNMSNMFSGLSLLQSLDLSSFNTSNVTSISYMFSECTALTTGYARNQTEADKFNNADGNPSNINFVVKT